MNHLRKNTIAFIFFAEKAALIVLKLGIFVSVMKSASALTLAACEKYSRLVFVGDI